MKKLINILLFGNTFFKEYPAVAIDENAIGEKVFFETGGKKFDVSDKHWLLSLEPMVFAIWSNENEFDANKECRMYFHSKRNKTVAVIHLNFTQKIAEKGGTLLLFEVVKSEISQLSPFKAKLIYWLYYRKPNQPFEQFKNLAAAFSYPRRVRLVSFQKDSYFNIFPMDLVGTMPGTNRFVFGLRHSNSTLSKIIQEKKIVAAEFPASMKEEVYQLAKHHSENPPALDLLPFEITETQLFGFPIPETAIQYHEIEIVKTIDLGSHMLLWGQAVNTVSINENKQQLYHIHFLNYLKQKEYELI